MEQIENDEALCVEPWVYSSVRAGASSGLFFSCPLVVENI